MINTKPPEIPTISHRNIFILFLSIYVLSALLIDTFFELPPDISLLLNNIDFFICLIFLADFFLGLYLAKNKWKFLKWGWIDFISSIPEVQALRWARVARVIRILRLLRGLRSTKLILEFLFKNKSQGTFLAVSMISVVLVLFSSIAILTIETSKDSNITTPSDALWWAFVTITTVGYGDLYPVTNTGRIIAAILMIAGVGLFGTFTAFVASYFVVPNESEVKNKNELSELKEEIQEIKLLLKKQRMRKDSNHE